MKKIVGIFVIVLMACATFFVSETKKAEAAICGFDEADVCCVKGGDDCYGICDKEKQL